MLLVWPKIQVGFGLEGLWKEDLEDIDIHKVAREMMT